MWNLPNLLSISRIVLAIPISWALWYHHTALAVALGILAMFTDYLDGYFARKLNQISETGKILDPLADKIIVITLILILTIQGRIPVWLSIMIFSRDILIMLGGIYLTKKLKYVVPSNKTGKWTVLFIGLYIIYKALDFSFFEQYIITFIAAMLVISFVQYLIRAIKLLKEQEI